jgi:SAM-dependent methyltransferase
MTQAATHEYAIAHAIELLLPTHREQALQRLRALELINGDTLPRWVEEFRREEYGSRLVHQLLAETKLTVDQHVEVYGGELSSRKTSGIVERLVNLLKVTDQNRFVRQDSIRGSTTLDFGAGQYSSLSSSIVLFANGYKQAIAHEPFPIEVDFVVSSAMQTLQWLTLDPAPFVFSGIDHSEMKQRLAQLDFEKLAERLAAFKQGKATTIDFNGVVLSKSLAHQTAASVDLIFSNSTLEHVGDLPAEIRHQYEILKRDGRCVHTVDFSDHRAIGTKMNAFEMYYDGVFDNINGLRPSQMEAIIARTGFQGTMIESLSVPAGYLPSARQMVAPFSGMSIDDLSVWVKSYVLNK